MTSPCGSNRFSYALLLLAVFGAFLIFGSRGTNSDASDLTKVHRTLSEKTTTEIFSFRNNTGNESTSTFGIKFLNIARLTQHGSLYNYSLLLESLKPADTASEINRFLCHVFYTFISTKAP